MSRFNINNIHKTHIKIRFWLESLKIDFVFVFGNIFNTFKNYSSNAKIEYRKCKNTASSFPLSAAYNSKYTQNVYLTLALLKFYEIQ